MSDEPFNPVDFWNRVNRSWNPQIILWRLNIKQRFANFASLFCHGRARAWRRRLARPAAILVDDDGGGSVDGNWAGAVRLAARGEEWPRSRDGRPLTPVLQLNVATSPVVPEQLKGVKLLTLFVAAPEDDYKTIYLPEWNSDEPEHGDGWVLRTYDSIDQLVAVDPPEGTRLACACPKRWEFVPDDSPNFLTNVCAAKWATRIAYDHKVHRQATRLGGWPTFIQGAWQWRPWAKRDDVPTYVLQVDSTKDLEWGDAGIAAIGRCDDGRWVITWQCY